MILITDDIRARLLANGAVEEEADHLPVVKLFDPCGAATWIITEMMADGDTLFGLCDLGLGCPELGSVSLGEIQSVQGRLGLGIERDIFFRPRFPLSVYADAARLATGITESEPLLRQVATRLGKAEIPLPPRGG